jgi:transposase
MHTSDTTNTNTLIPKNPQNTPDQEPPHLWVGLDWGDQKHAFALQDRAGHCEEGLLYHSPERLHAWLKSLEERTGGHPVRLGIETSRGAVIHALLQYPWLEIYPINPVTSARYRTAFKPSGAKDDLPDAWGLLELVRDKADKLRPLQEQDSQTVKLNGLVEARRGIVDQRTGVINQLTSLLKSYFPQALELFEDLNSLLAIDFLRRWPDLIRLKTAKPGTIKRFYYQHQVRSDKLVEQRLERIKDAVALTVDDARVSVAILQLHQLLDQLEVLRKHVARFDIEIKSTFAAHPEASLFRDLPGAGPQMAPRLCVAFGTIRTVYPDPSSLQKYAGVAPVREKSGNQLWTHWRWRAPAFLRQTFVEWAGLTVRYSAWAGCYYDHMRKKGKHHAAIIRSLAFKWIRILWKCWKDGIPYDETRYLKQLIHRKSPHAVAL